MSTRSFLKTLWAAVVGDVSIQTDPVNLSTVSNAAFEFVATGTLVGTAKIQARNDDTLAWKDTTLTYAVNVGTGNTGTLFDLPIGFGFKYARIAWVRTSGTGTVSGNVNKKI